MPIADDAEGDIQRHSARSNDVLAAFDPNDLPHKAFLPGFVAPSACTLFVQNVLEAPSRRVTVGAKTESWTEYSISGTSLGAFLASDEVFDLAARASKASLVRAPLVWAQSYVAGEKISWHCDGAGVIQFLLCLEAPPADHGGAFCMRTDHGEVRLALRAGDALLFDASAIPHCTSRLVASLEARPVRRITAVARFHALPNE